MRNCLSIILISTFLSACGGGGGSTSPAPTPAPVASTLTFPLKNNYVARFNQSRTSTRQITGTISGQTVVGSLTSTQSSPTSATFETISGFSKFSSTTGSYTANGLTYQISSTGTNYWDTNYNPTGSSGSEYMVVSSGQVLPATVRVGDTNQWFVGNRYSTSTKATFLGTVTVSWTVEADTANTALFKLTSTSRNLSNVVTELEVATYRIDSAGAYDSINTNVVTSTSNITITD